jgi:hypothetical protein
MPSDVRDYTSHNKTIILMANKYHKYMQRNTDEKYKWKRWLKNEENDDDWLMKDWIDAKIE